VREGKRAFQSIGKIKPLFTQSHPPASAHPLPPCSRWCPRLRSARTPPTLPAWRMPGQGVPEAPHARGEPALSAAGRPQARAAGHGQDGGAGDGQPARLGLLSAACRRLGLLGEDCCLQRWRRCGRAVAETGAHDGTASMSKRLVHTHAGVQHAAKIRGAAHEQPRDALGRQAGRRTVSPHHPSAVAGRPQAEDQTRAAGTYKPA
jgi:hypothetical protein